MGPGVERQQRSDVDQGADHDDAQQGADHAALAAGELDAAQDAGGDEGDIQPVAIAGRAGKHIGAQQDPGDPGAHAANEEAEHLGPADVDAGGISGFLIAAHHEDTVAETGVVEQEPKAHETQDEQDDGQLEEAHTEQLIGIERTEQFAVVGDRLPVAQKETHPAQGGHGGDGGDEGAHMETGNEKTVEQSDEPAYDDGGDDPGHSPKLGPHQRGHDGGQGHRHAQGQVDLSADQQEGHSDGHDAVHAQVRGQLDQIIGTGKIRDAKKAIEQDDS